MSARVFEGVRIWRVEPAAMAAAVRLITRVEATYAPQVVVGIARGGWPIAQALATRLGLAAVAVAARHNDSDTVGLAATGVVQVDMAALARIPAGARLVVVDDISGSGATLAAVTVAITTARAPVTLRTVTLCRNIGTAFVPHTWVWDVADWTCFPWEPAPAEPTQPLPIPTTVQCR